MTLKVQLIVFQNTLGSETFVTRKFREFWLILSQFAKVYERENCLLTDSRKFLFLNFFMKAKTLFWLMKIIFYVLEFLRKAAFFNPLVPAVH